MTLTCVIMIGILIKNTKTLNHLFILGVKAYAPADSWNEGAFVDIDKPVPVGVAADGGFHGAEF